MDANYLYIGSLREEVEVPRNGILSRTLFSDDNVKVIIFGFDAGQELSKHTASSEAFIHILKGNARITLGDEVMEAGEGAHGSATRACRLCAHSGRDAIDDAAITGHHSIAGEGPGVLIHWPDAAE